MCRNPKRGTSWAILRHRVRALGARRGRGKQTVVRNEAEKNGKASSHKVWILFKGQQEATEEFTPGRDMVRFTVLEVPLGFWVWNGL